MKKLQYFLLIILFLMSCNPSSKVEKYSFYHWKSTFQEESLSNQFLKELAVDTLYIRYFDVEKKGNAAHPIAKIQFKNVPKQEIIPVVFIVNEVLIDISKEEVIQLSDNIYYELKKLHPKEKKPFKTLQLDCDWTESSRENYFLLCSELGKKVSVTSTIRLHQFRYPEKTGIPPVKKGIVMCYATESPLNDTIENSILDKYLLEQYLSKAQKYSLAVDYALPIYSWGIVTNHIGKHRIIYGITSEELRKDKRFEEVQQNTFKVKQNCYLKSFQLSENFTIRIEDISLTLLNQSKKIIEKNAKQHYKLIYYQLDSSCLQKFTPIQLKN